MSSEPSWRIAVDTGGTFTDCLAVAPDGRRLRAKVLSSGALRLRVARRPAEREVELAGPETFADGFFEGWQATCAGRSVAVAESTGNRLTLAKPLPEATDDEIVLRSREEAAVVAVRWVTGTAPGRTLPPVRLRLATTRGTNALLERAGGRVALFVTRGFGDLMEIGNQQRPDLFALEIRKPEPLHEAVVEVAERLEASGAVLEELDEEMLAERAARLFSRGFRFAAVAFLHSFRNSRHEDRAARVLRVAGFRHVSRSSDLSRRIRFLPRAQVALVDAYLAEILGTYLDGVVESLQPRSLHVMTSAGGLVRASQYRAKDSLLSGPAAGVVGAVAAGRRSGFERILAFDMGGTSTDVSRFDGRVELRDETVVGDVRLLSASIAVETVAAGGGSICRWRSGGVGVGPESAGAEPGPACYGAGGPLTVTDLNLLLGRLVPSRFPFRLDAEASARRADEIEAAAGRLALSGSHLEGRARADRERAATHASTHASRDAFLAGFLAIANEKMAGAIRAISLRRGYDPADYGLVAFGGAGAQHAAALADLLGIRRVLIPAGGALLSAQGLHEGQFERWSELQILEPLASAGERLPERFAELAAQARTQLEAEGVPSDSIEVGTRIVFLRYRGQESTLAVDWSDDLAVGDLVTAFEGAYRARYGYLPETGAVEVESLRLSALSSEGGASGAVAPGGRADGREASESAPTQRFWDGAGWVEAPIFERGWLATQRSAAGPCLVVESHTVTVVEKGWRAQVDNVGGLILERGR